MLSFSPSWDRIKKIKLLLTSKKCESEGDRSAHRDVRADALLTLLTNAVSFALKNKQISP